MPDLREDLGFLHVTSNSFIYRGSGDGTQGLINARHVFYYYVIPQLQKGP